jgi:alkyl hydroperoxide reductase subunit AhpC
VCTTELGAAANLASDFEKRNVKMFGISCDSLKDHDSWINDINEVNNCNLSFPLLADHDRSIATLYNMLD